MKTHASVSGLFVFPVLCLLAAAPALYADEPQPLVFRSETSAPVTVKDDGNTWILDNGIVKAAINKRTGNTVSFVYNGIEVLTNGGIWEQTPAAAAETNSLTDSITIDPEKNGGERAEVSVKGVTNDKIFLGGGVG